MHFVLGISIAKKSPVRSPGENSPLPLGHFSFLRFKKDKFHLGSRQTKTEQLIKDMEALQLMKMMRRSKTKSERVAISSITFKKDIEGKGQRRKIDSEVQGKIW